MRTAPVEHEQDRVVSDLGLTCTNPPVTMMPAVKTFAIILFSKVTPLLMRTAAPAPFTKVQLRITVWGENTRMWGSSFEFGSNKPSLSYRFSVQTVEDEPVHH